MQTLGERIREYRISIKMTQTDFATRLGITGASVFAYENGTRLPSYEVLVKIADALGVTTDELLGRKKENRVTIDVTNLTPRERSVVQDLIDLLKEKPPFQVATGKVNINPDYKSKAIRYSSKRKNIKSYD